MTPARTATTLAEARVESRAGGSLRVPGQGAVRALRHSRLRRPARDDAGGGARAAEELGGPVVVKAQVLTGGRGQGGRHQARRGSRGRRGEGAATSSASTSAGTSCASSGSSRPPTSRRSTTSRSRSIAARSSRCSCSRPRAASRSNRSPRRTRTRSRACTSIRSKAFQPYQARRLIYGAGIDDPDEQKQILAIIEKLYRCFVESDAMLCEINPLIVTPDGEVQALDSKFTVDDSALFRHPDIAEMRDVEAADPQEALAREKGVTYVKLDGDVGILGNGAGLSMSTVDVVVVAGGRPANFCDLGGGGDAQGVVDALEVITSDDAGALDLLQHLRRHHALRRGRARDPHGARPDEDRAADRRPPRRDERRGGAAGSRPRRRRRTSTSSRRCWRPRNARWSWPHDATSGAARARPSATARRIAKAPTSTCSSSGASPART